MAGAGEPGYPPGLDEQVSQLPTQIKGKLSAIGGMGPTPGAPGTLRTPELAALERGLARVVGQMGDRRTGEVEKGRVAEAALGAMEDTIRALDETLRGYEGGLRKRGAWPAASAERPPSGAGGGARKSPRKVGGGLKSPRMTAPRSTAANGGAKGGEGGPARMFPMGGADVYGGHVRELGE